MAGCHHCRTCVCVWHNHGELCRQTLRCHLRHICAACMRCTLHAGIHKKLALVACHTVARTHTHTHAHVTKAICIILSVHSKHQPADMQLQLSQMQQVPQPTGTTYGQGMPTAGGSNNPAKTPIEAYCHLPAAQDRRYSNAYKNTYTMSSMHTISRAKMQVMVSHCSSKRSAAVQHCGSVEHPCTHIEVAACQLPP